MTNETYNVKIKSVMSEHISLVSLNDRFKKIFLQEPHKLFIQIVESLQR